MENKYVCSICGKTHYDLGEYVDCVTRCSKKIKEQEEKEKKQKYLEELNAALNRVKEAESYFKQQLNEFKEKYPEEYKFNFEDVKEEKDCNCDDKKTCGGICGGCKDTNTCNPVNNWLEFSYKNDGKNTPEIHASVNGKKVKDDALEKLFEDPDTKYLAQLLGLL